MGLYHKSRYLGQQIYRLVLSAFYHEYDSPKGPKHHPVNPSTAINEMIIKTLY